MQRPIIGLGLMSGTSLDGLDLCLASFAENNAKWNYQIIATQTIHYENEWFERLKNIETKSALELAQTHVDYGHFIGHQVALFLKQTPIKPDFIASHGHTIFHQPEHHLTLQIGDGSAIAAITGISVICDFRSKDLALNGQGAPLVPIGDQLLFQDFDACLNIGGFSNISYSKNAQRIAFDICPANIVLNHFSKQLGQSFDKDGLLAQKGRIEPHLLNALNALDFYTKKGQKSLGKEWVLKNIYPLIQTFNLQPYDVLCTFTEHIAFQINSIIETMEGSTVLVTGGGCKNKYLMQRFQNLSSKKIIIPDEKLIDYKEALIFAFLGLLRFLNKNNCLK